MYTIMPCCDLKILRRGQKRFVAVVKMYTNHISQKKVKGESRRGREREKESEIWKGDKKRSNKERHLCYAYKQFCILFKLHHKWSNFPYCTTSYNYYLCYQISPSNEFII